MSHTSNAPARKLPIYFRPALFPLLLLAGVVVPELMLARGPQNLPYRVGMLALSVAGTLCVVLAIYFQVRSEDELWRKVHAQALSLAFTGAIVLGFIGESANDAGLVGELTWSLAGIVLLALYSGAYYLVWLRYR
jgi:hypothetical protein